MGATGFLFACAPDSAACASHPEAIPILQLIGDYEEAKVNAHALAVKLLDGEPMARGTRQLGIFEEQIIRELHRAFHLLHLHRTLVSRGIKQCHFEGGSPLTGQLAAMAAHLESGLSVGGPAVRPYSPWARINRVWQRLRSEGFNAAAVRREWRHVMERLDPYHRRGRTAPRLPAGAEGGIWFYSTAYTFTQIGLYYEPYFPQPFNYLIENPQTGGEPLRVAQRPSTSIYAFGTRSMEPSADEVEAAQRSIVAHLRRLALPADEDAARQYLLRSRFFEVFLNYHLPQGLYATSLFANWAERTRPAALVVGNPIFEAYALRAARSRNIPTVLLQHGVLGDFCQFFDPCVDHYVVRGDFWREFLAPAPRSRAHVLEPHRPAPVTSRTGHAREAILFLTGHYRSQPFVEFADFADLDDILSTLLEASATAECELIVRVHPLENIDFYRSRLERLAGTRKALDRVTYSQGVPLDEVLDRTAVAVTFCSTVFLECLHRKIPIVSFGWHQFPYKRQIERHGVFHFARDLAALSALARRGAAGDLPPYAQDARPFIAPTPDELLRAQLAKLIQHKPAECRDNAQ